MNARRATFHILTRTNLLTFAIGVVSNAASVVATCVVLSFAGIIYHNPNTRTALRRQSLVMLLAALIMSIFFNVANMYVVRLYPKDTYSRSIISASYFFIPNTHLCSIGVAIMLFSSMSSLATFTLLYAQSANQRQLSAFCHHVNCRQLASEQQLLLTKKKQIAAAEL